MADTVGEYTGIGVGVIQMSQQTAYQMALHGPVQGSLAVGVAAGMHLLVGAATAAQWEKATSFFDPILKAPAQLATKIVQWMRPAEGTQRTREDERVLRERVAIVSTGVVAGLSTLAAHVVCTSTAALPFSPLFLGAAFGAHSYIMNLFTDFTRERDEAGPDLLGNGAELTDIDFTFAAFFDRLILRVNLEEDPAESDAVGTVALQWRVVAFVVASIGFTAFLSSSVLACTIAYPLAALVGTVVKRYYQIGSPVEAQELGRGVWNLDKDSGSYRRGAESCAPSAFCPSPYGVPPSSVSFSGPALASLQPLARRK